MTTWDEYLNEIDEEQNDDSPIYSSLSVNTGLILNGNLQQSAGEIQATGLKLDDVSLTTIQTGSESFVDNDTSLMTSAAIQDKIEAYGYSTTTGDITGVTAGTGLSGGGASGAVTLNVAGLTVSELHADTLQTSSESFADNDTSVMSSAAIQDKIESYGYSTTTGDITGVTAGTGLSGGGASGAVTLNVSGLTVSEFAGASIQTGSESFSDDDTSLMTSAAIQDKILSYSYITGVTNISGNAATATALATARAINGVDFDGTAAITVTADANTLSGTTLKSTVVNSSLTSVGTLTHDLTIGDTLILTGDSTSHVSNNTTSGREILQLRGKTANADGAGINLYGDGDSSNANKTIFFNSDATSMVIEADGRMKWGGGSDWKNWTPTWNNLTIGNATVTAKYQVVDETVFWLLKVVFGSTTSVGTSTVYATLPLETNNSTTYQNLAQCWLRPTGGTIYNGPCISYADRIYFYGQYPHTSVTNDYIRTANMKNTIPATWNTSGLMYAHGQYRTDE